MKTIVELKTLGNQWNQKRLKKATDACLLIEKVINTAQFKEAVLSANMTNKNGLSNLEIYEAIMMADEIQYNEKNDLYVMNIEYKLVKKNWSQRLFGTKVMGYGYAHQLMINTYVDVFDNLDLPSLAGHLAHEALHKYGWNDFAKEKTSVTYVVGFIIEYLARKL